MFTLIRLFFRDVFADVTNFWSLYILLFRIFLADIGDVHFGWCRVYGHLFHTLIFDHYFQLNLLITRSMDGMGADRMPTALQVTYRVQRNVISNLIKFSYRPSRFVPRSTMSRDIIERGTNRLGL